MEHAESSQTVSLRAYVLTYVSLLVLATVSWLVSVFNVPGGLVLALVIAAIKALLVLAYFMHLAEEAFSFKLAIASAAVLVMIFVGLTALDPLTRERQAQYGAEPATPRDAAAQR